MQLVECPRCGHQATGALFVDLQAPLPVVLVENTDSRAQRMPSPVPAAIAAADHPDAPVSDHPDAADADLAAPAWPDERMRPMRDERTVLMRDERTLLMGDERTVLMGDERTGLVLDSPFLKRELRTSEAPAPAPASSAAGRRVAAAKLGASDGERTHLLLDPLDLHDDRETAFTRVTATLRPLARRALRLSVALDELMHGRWNTALLVLAVAAGLLPPLFDYLTDDPASTLSLFTTVLSLLGCALFVLAGLAKLRRDDGAWDYRVAGGRVQTLTRRFAEDLQELGRSPRYLKLHLSGQLLVLLGLSGLALAGSRSIVRLVLGASDPASLLRFASGLLLLGGVLLLRAGLRATPPGAPGPVELAESTGAASKMPAIIDLSEPLPASLIGDDTGLHRILFALSEWRAREWPDAVGYQAALERHLQRHLPACRIERERWLGRERRAGIADVVVDDLVLIEVAHGFRQPCAERTIARIERHAGIWLNKPMLLAIFDASREAVLDSGATAPLVELHRRLPLVTARMPTRRR